MGAVPGAQMQGQTSVTTHRVTELNEDCAAPEPVYILSWFLSEDTVCYLGLAPGKDIFFSSYMLLLIAARLHFTSVNQAPLCQAAGCVNITKAHRQGGMRLPSLQGISYLNRECVLISPLTTLYSVKAWSYLRLHSTLSVFRLFCGAGYHRYHL